MTTNMNTGINITTIPQINRNINQEQVMMEQDNQVNDIQLLNADELLANIEYKNIDELLQNSEQYINSTPWFNNPNESQMASYNYNNLPNEIDMLVNDLGDLNMDDTEDEQMQSDDEPVQNPLYSKFVPLEVAQYYCREYFDDEDFIYVKFELPDDLLEEIMESGNKTITEYFDSFLNNVDFAEDDTQEILYYNMYMNCVLVYDRILEHYKPYWYDYDGPIEDDKYNKFDDTWTYYCKNMLEQLNEVMIMGMQDDSLKYLCSYNKEVYAGIIIIIMRLKELCSAFPNSAMKDYMDETHDYRKITIRLINNICVILLYLKFYYMYNSVYNKEDNPESKSSRIKLKKHKKT